MKNYKAHILVVDDDDGIRNLVKKFLNEKSFLVNKFDLIILDIMMPGKSGLEFLNENKSFIDTPVILLTAKGEPKERVEGLESGADDYLPKPFEPQELLLRIKNILSKTQKKNLIRAINFGNIKIDLTKLLIIKEKKELKINTTEKKILDKMINQPGKVFSRNRKTN